MNSRDRLFTALAHREPDRVPLDLGSTQVSTIHVAAYRNLCRYLGIDPEPVEMADIVQQVVRPGEALLDRFGVDTRGLFPMTSHNSGFEDLEDVGDAWRHVDEWGLTQQLKKEHGYWWAQVGFPLSGPTVDPAALAAYPWPNAADPRRIDGLRARAAEFRGAGKVVVCKGLCAGMFEMAQRLRGMENCLCDLLADPDTAAHLLDNVLRLKIEFWSMLLDELGDLVDIVAEGDDYGTQQSQLISPGTYKRLIAPRLRELIGFIKQKHAEKRPPGEPGYVFFHSCGNVRPYLPDFIDMGIDILNPVHGTATGMEPAALKRDFGREITFWGGGVDTQGVLPNGTPQQVRDDVRRNVEVLMPGGGFVFNTVHNIQAEVPPENVVAMWEALREMGGEARQGPYGLSGGMV